MMTKPANLLQDSLSDSSDASLSVIVTLDDNKPGYGIVLCGNRDKLISMYPIISKAAVPADGKWQRVVIDIDKALDEYLGNIPHRIVKMRIGDMREMDFGWWKDTDKRTFYIDEFSIRKR